MTFTSLTIGANDMVAYFNNTRETRPGCLLTEHSGQPTARGEKLQ